MKFLSQNSPSFPMLRAQIFCRLSIYDINYLINKFKFEMKSIALILLITLATQLLPVFSYENCGNITGSGCFDCLSNLSLAYNISENKYTCINTANCSQVTNRSCNQCTRPFILDKYSQACVESPGCLKITNNTCTDCDTNYQLINSRCYYKQIPFCKQYIYDNQTLQCNQCIYHSLDPDKNCTTTIPSLCLQFDFSIMKCTSCANNTRIHSSGTICYVEVENCALYNNWNPPSCIQCQPNYALDNSNCILSFLIQVDSEILSYNATSMQITYENKCINNLEFFNTNSTCTPSIYGPHCLDSQCSICFPGYFPKVGKCLQCDIYISNCDLCDNQVNCKACKSGYYRLNISSSQSKCMPCSSYGCLQCSTLFNEQNKVECISCPVNSTLFAGSCYSCPTGQAFEISKSKCQSCDEKCSFCKFTQFNKQKICIQCLLSYFYNQSTRSCQEIPQNMVLSHENSKQILKKAIPNVDKIIFNDQSSLMSHCQNTDGFICLCNLASETSICSKTAFSLNISELNYTDQLIFAQYSNELKLAAQFESFNYDIQLKGLGTNILFTEEQFSNLLAAYSLIIIRQQAQIDIPTQKTSQIIKKIKEHSKTMQKSFSDQRITIIRGNGFYFKSIPQNLKSGDIGDDNYIRTNLDSSFNVVFYSYYSKLTGKKNGLLTGTFYIFTNNTYNYNIEIKQSRFYENSSKLTDYQQGVISNITVTLDNGYLILQNPSKDKSHQIYGTGQSIPDIYITQRIQNIFYSQSWLYILFFIVLYLVFIPFCAIVDCCDPSEAQLRKKVGSSDASEEKKQEASQQMRVKINYRQFFPLYNVGNTPRSRRLTKVCLFIINMQHIVTFLTLIYFNLPPQLPVAAIALVIPGYLCCVVMGYMVGALFRFLPGNFKYLINLISFGYWILWIFLMKIMSENTSKQYRLYILVFSILSFLLDLLIDALETLLVYFSIKQNQQALFKCLARWLSLRGYYQFDKLAHQLFQA